MHHHLLHDFHVAFPLSLKKESLLDGLTPVAESNNSDIYNSTQCGLNVKPDVTDIACFPTSPHFSVLQGALHSPIQQSPTSVVAAAVPI